MPNEEASMIAVLRDGCSEHGCMLVTVAREKMCEQVRLDARRNIDATDGYVPG